MALEPAFDNIDDLVPANPADNDPVDEGDDHLRGIKKALQGNVTGDATVTRFKIGDGAITVGLASASGLDVLSPDDASSLRFGIRNAANDANLAAFRIDGAGKLFIENKAPGDHTEIRGRNLADDADIPQAIFDPELGADIYAQGNKTLSILPEAAGVIGTILQVAKASTDSIFNMAFNDSGGIGLHATATGNPAIFQASATGANEANFARFVRGGEFELFHDGTRRLVSESIDTILIRPSTGTTARIRFADLNGTHTCSIASTATQLFLRGAIGGEVSLQRDDTENVLVSSATGTGIYGGGTERLKVLATSTGNSFATVDETGGTAQPVGFNRSPRLDVAASRTLAVTDVGKTLRTTATQGLTINTGVFATGDQINFVGAGNTTTFAQGAGFTLSWLQGGSFGTGNRAFASGSACTIWFINSNSAYIWGNGLS